MPWILANDFSGLQAGENAADSNRRMALASAMNAMQTGLQSKSVSDRAAAQMDFAKKQHEDEMAMQAQKLELEMGKQSIESSRYADQNTISKGYLDLQKQALDQQKQAGTPAENREHDMTWSRAVQDADSGSFDNPQHVATLYPKLSTPEQTVLAQRSADARRNIDANYDVASRTADTLNKHQHLSRMIPMSQEAVNSGHWFWPDSDSITKAKGELKEASDAKSILDPVVANIRNDKRLGSMITFNPDNNSYEPAVPVPSWRNRQSANASNVPPPSPEAPLGWQPTSGGNAFRPILAPQAGSSASPGAGSGTPAAPTAAAAPATGAAAYKPKYNDWVYNRANEIRSQNPSLPPAAALQRAIQEDAALFGR